jgi:hypothetical protein
VRLRCDSGRIGGVRWVGQPAGRLGVSQRLYGSVRACLASAADTPTLRRPRANTHFLPNGQILRCRSAAISPTIQP